MKITALVMAGGRGKRMRKGTAKVVDGVCEKPLVKVGGMTMLERVVGSLKSARHIKRVVLATSVHTPHTTRMGRRIGVEIIVAPGKGYVRDMKFALKNLKTRWTIIVNADLPLIDAKTIEGIISRYLDCRKPALTTMVSASALKQLGFKPRYNTKINGQSFAPIGINILDARRINDERVEEYIMLFKDASRLINVNTQEELQKAKELLRILSHQNHGVGK